jgi:putative membrane protein
MTNVGWWCSAQTGPWSWTPQFYPGIWAAMVGLLVGYVYAIKRIGPSKVEPGEEVVTRSQVTSFVVGYVLLWVATDWPLGVLGAGYLLTAHMIQYILYSLIVAPLLIRGAPPWMRELVWNAPGMGWARFLVDRPLFAFFAFNAVLALTHLPFIADTLKPIQFGSMAMDMLWLIAALIFWSAIGDFDQEGDASTANARRLVYVLGITVLPTIPGAFFVFSEFPIYTTFEFATRAFSGVSAKEDQVIAGLLMWMGTMPILMARLAMAFFAWSATESKRAGQI